ncbi:MAG: Rossmann-like and DUF2520 domain-containing protein [Flavobacteriaceae bacterium]
MQSVVLIGAGNVAHHLAKAFSACPHITLVATMARDKKALVDFEAFGPIASLGRPITADIVVIAVSDNAIATVSGQLQGTNSIIVHTSGSTPMKVLSQHKNHGVLYPLQSFTKGRELTYDEIPICVESNSTDTLYKIKQLAGYISSKVVEIDSKKRFKLHMAAVIGNNFTNHMVYLAEQFLQEEKLPLHLLVPLMKETVEKWEDTSPYDAQTGPARRWDTDTIKNHLAHIKDSKLRKIYTLLSQSVQETYREKDNG